ncbi:MAG: SRPBCC domain-containing protein [Rhodothermales bacterium]|nr:SRPBCC domain-containing protein [Rhodothermales bacterium]
MPVTSVVPDLDTYSLTITAQFAAARERLWAIYADPRQLERIWGPPSLPATFLDHQLTAGARSTYFMTGPDGQKYHGFWRVTRVDEPNGFSFEDGFADSDYNPVPDMPVSETDFTFEESDGGTRATYVSTYASREALEKVLEMGVVEGATAAINNIDGLLGG